VILGIDPGLDGALALYDPATAALQVEDMPTFTLPKGKGERREVDAYALGRIIGDWSQSIKAVWLEHVSSSPQQGVTSAFTFGRSYGVVEGVCAANFLSMVKVTPQAWKRHYGLKGGVQNKDASIAKASSLLPRSTGFWTRKKDNGRAEAALIALYGARAA
jgi:crossover junction endodeoxyribonuclease RuvC